MITEPVAGIDNIAPETAIHYKGITMKKIVVLVLLSLTLVFTALVPSCSSSVDKKQYDMAMEELTTLRDKKTKAEIYALFLDRLMSQFYQQANLPSRYQFNSIQEWSDALDAMAATIADPKLISLLAKMKTNSAAFLELENYLTDQIVTTLK
jgi:hypothetical protein